MDVADGRSAGFGRIGGELRASTYTPLQLPSTAAPAHSLPVVRRSTLRPWSRLATVAAVVIVVALVATVAIMLNPRPASDEATQTALPAPAGDVPAQTPQSPAALRPRG